MDVVSRWYLKSNKYRIYRPVLRNNMPDQARANRKQNSTPTYHFFLFPLPEGGEGTKTPPPPLRHKISYVQ